MDDIKLIKLMEKGNTRGLEALIEKYRGLACSVALSVLGRANREDVLECVNSAFYDVWLSMSTYDRQRSSLKGWVALLTRRRAVDQLRKNLRRNQACINNFSEEVLVAPDSCDRFLDREAFYRLFNQFVLGLPEPDRSIFVRRFFALESIPALAQRYNLTRGAVDSRLSRLRKSLKETLEGS
jgi:RNA polymerase sigma-70 factor (ECF subfamily)